MTSAVQDAHTDTKARMDDAQFAAWELLPDVDKEGIRLGREFGYWVETQAASIT